MTFLVSDNNLYFLRLFFLSMSALFVFALPLVDFPAAFNISYVLMLVSGIMFALHQKSIAFDIEIALAIAFVVIVFVGGMIHVETFWEDRKGALWTCRILLQVFSLLILFKFVRLQYDEVVRFIMIPTVFSSMILLLIGLYKFYFLQPTAFTYIDSTGALVSRFFIFDNPNLSAIFATISLGFVLPFMQDSSLWIRRIACIGVGMLFVTLLYLGSRVGIFIFCVLCMSYMGLSSYFSHKIKWAVVGVMLFSVILFFWMNIEVVMLKILYGNEIRPIIYQVGLEHFLQAGYYWFGIGSGEFFKIDFTPFLGEEYKRIFHAHNLFLHILIENGLLGLLCYLALWACLIKRAWDKRKNQTHHPVALQAFWLILLAHVIFSLTEATFFYRNAIWLIFLAIITIEVRSKEV